MKKYAVLRLLPLRGLSQLSFFVQELIDTLKKITATDVITTGHCKSSVPFPGYDASLKEVGRLFLRFTMKINRASLQGAYKTVW
jgi:hypothetical protein